MHVDSQEMREYVRRLQQQNRLLLVCAVVLAVFLLLGAARSPTIVRANAFELTDASGRVRAELAIRDGAAGLFVMDDGGGERVRLWHGADATGLYIVDDTGTTRIGVAQFAHGGGGVALHGPGSAGAAVLYLKGDGSLRFFDADGNVTNAVLARPAD